MLQNCKVVINGTQSKTLLLLILEFVNMSEKCPYKDQKVKVLERKLSANIYKAHSKYTNIRDDVRARRQNGFRSGVR